MDWQFLADQWILRPSRPRAVIQFLGGAFIGTAPHLAYDALLHHLAKQNFLVIATPYFTTPDHWAIADDVLGRGNRLISQLNSSHLPRYGLGHSLGCKLHILASTKETSAKSRQGNIFMAYSNASFRDNLPWMPLEFNPDPAATNRVIQQNYSIANTLLVKFTQDDIDDISQLQSQLTGKFPTTTTYRQLPGTHGTSVASRYPSPSTELENIPRSLYQTLTPPSSLLHRTITAWLNRQIAQEEICRFSSRTTL